MPPLKHQPRHRPRAGSKNHARRLDPVSQASCVVSSRRNCNKRLHQTQIELQNLNRHYDSNQQYSITAISDGGGEVVERYVYSAYGQVTIADGSGAVISNSAIANRYTYTGREWDEVLGVYYYRARMYETVGGRFVSRDPIGFNSTDVNLYRFVFNQPLVQLDPSGLKCTVYVALTHGPNEGYFPDFWETIGPIKKNFDECDFIAPVCCWIQDGKRICRETFGSNDRDPVPRYWPDFDNDAIDLREHSDRQRIRQIFNHFLRLAMNECCSKKGGCDCKDGCKAKVLCHEEIEPMIINMLTPNRPGPLSSNPCGKELSWNCRRKSWSES